MLAAAVPTFDFYTIQTPVIPLCAGRRWGCSGGGRRGAGCRGARASQIPCSTGAGTRPSKGAAHLVAGVCAAVIQILTPTPFKNWCCAARPLHHANFRRQEFQCQQQTILATGIILALFHDRDVDKQMYLSKPIILLPDVRVISVCVTWAALLSCPEDRRSEAASVWRACAVVIRVQLTLASHKI